jgi:hypothetical protein
MTSGWMTGFQNTLNSISGKEEIMNETDHEKVFRKSSSEEKPKFDEAPGEAEADAVRDAFLKNAGTEPENVASALSVVDGSTRSRAINRLQRQRGNNYVQRVVEDAQNKRGIPGSLVGLSQPEMVAEVQQRKDPGHELPDNAREKLENHFGADLSGVRVHTGSESEALNRELNAQAFTVGSDIFMGEGKYQPASPDGQGLLAHELTHVGQQGGFGVAGVQREAGPEEDEEVQRQANPEEEEEQGSE